MEVSSISKSILQGYSFAYSSVSIDSEEKEIIARLLAYGASPTGDKQSDKALLHRIELEKARQEVNSNPSASVSADKYLTVSQGEINAMCEKKEEKKKDINLPALSGSDILSAYNSYIIDVNKKKNKQNK